MIESQLALLQLIDLFQQLQCCSCVSQPKIGSGQVVSFPFTGSAFACEAVYSHALRKQAKRVARTPPEYQTYKGFSL